MSQITVIVPVYKVEAYLRRCINSILSQTFKDFDLILIDDGSPDQCGAICDEYNKIDHRVFVIHHKENLGLSAARNSGIDLAFANSDSQWISFVDSDDWIHPLYLEALYDAAQEYGISATFYLDTNGENPFSCIENLKTTIWKTTDFLLQCSTIATISWGKLYRKSDFKSIRFPPGKIHEDMFTTHLVINQHTKIPIVTPPLYAYSNNPHGITKSPWTSAKLAKTEALEQQILFYVSNEQITLARSRFFSFIRHNKAELQNIKNCSSLSDEEREQLLKRNKKQLQRVLLRYHRYRWVSPWRRGEDLWLYSYAFPVVHAVHMIWRKIKSIWCKTT